MPPAVAQAMSIACALLLGAVAAVDAATSAYDVVVYDATSGGVMAAVAAGRHGSHTALVRTVFHTQAPSLHSQLATI